jgi:hypothetical protein
MNRTIIGLALVAAALVPLVSVAADDRAAPDTHPGPTAGRGGSVLHNTDPRAQSGAEAADEARIYSARLRRCEDLRGVQRGACVDAAKRRLRQL